MSVENVVRATGLVLLDFDGPITPLLPSGSNMAVADAARAEVSNSSLKLPDELSEVSDHLAILRYAATFPKPVLDLVEQVCLQGEIEAAMKSELTPGARETLEAFKSAQRSVVIVSNNRAEAIDIFMRRTDLLNLTGSIIGRVPGRPDLMKPSPRLVLDAIQRSGADQLSPRHHVFIGDSITDIEVGRRVGVQTIGYAKSEARGRELAAAGADAVTDSMYEIASAVRQSVHP
jgi:phosphoglycolate phosphatase